MDTKSFSIGILSLTATVLLVANYFATPVAHATDTIRDRDYGLVTARSQAGGESLYVLDNRSGLVAVFAYDNSRRQLVSRFAGDLTGGSQGK